LGGWLGKSSKVISTATQTAQLNFEDLNTTTLQKQYDIRDNSRILYNIGIF
jgi:hypothetical protein